MLDDRPPVEDAPPAEPGEAPAPASFNPLFAFGGVVIMLLAAMLVVSGLLVPLAVMLGLVGAFVALQALIFRVFFPRG